MLLFKPEHVPLILEGRKTQTRRLWSKPRVKVGNVYQARTRMLDKTSTFALLRVKRVWHIEDVAGISEKDAWAEGYDSSWEYLLAFARINPGRLVSSDRFAPLSCWAVEFEVLPMGGG